MRSATFLRLVVTVGIISSIILTPKVAYAASWTDTITFDETAFPSSTTTLTNGATLSYDLYTGSGAAGVQPTAGADGVTDLTVTATVVTSPGNNWPQAEADYATSSNGSFRSDWTVATSNDSDSCSAPNMYGYVKFDFTFSGALSAIQANQFATRHTSTNGSSEAYEYTLVTLNGMSNSTIESNIGSYTNIDYASGTTASEHILGAISPDASVGGGQMATSFWAVDDFNTEIIDGNEDPTAGDGKVADNQTIGGSASSDSGDGNFGLADGTIVTQLTYYFGLHDVAFDLDGDGCTGTNTLPSAGITELKIGFDEVTAVELASFDAVVSKNGTIINWTTAAEIDNAGFNVYGAPAANGPWTRLNKGLIPATGGPATATEYRFNDESGSVFYMLEDVDISGATTQHGPIRADATATDAARDAFSLFLPLLQK